MGGPKFNSNSLSSESISISYTETSSFENETSSSEPRSEFSSDFESNSLEFSMPSEKYTESESIYSSSESEIIEPIQPEPFTSESSKFEASDSESVLSESTTQTVQSTEATIPTRKPLILSTESSKSVESESNLESFNEPSESLVNASTSEISESGIVASIDSESLISETSISSDSLNSQNINSSTTIKTTSTVDPFEITKSSTAVTQIPSFPSETLTISQLQDITNNFDNFITFATIDVRNIENYIFGNATAASSEIIKLKNSIANDPNSENIVSYLNELLTDLSMLLNENNNASSLNLAGNLNKVKSSCKSVKNKDKNESRRQKKIVEFINIRYDKLMTISNALRDLIDEWKIYPKNRAILSLKFVRRATNGALKSLKNQTNLTIEIRDEIEKLLKILRQFLAQNCEKEISSSSSESSSEMEGKEAWNCVVKIDIQMPS